MRRRLAHAGQGGYTLLEVTIAAIILLIGMIGFAGTSITAAHASGAAHARTTMTLIRGAFVDRLTLTPRTSFASLPTAWAVDGCYDAQSRLIAANTGYASTFACPTTPVRTAFQTWLQVTPNGTTSWKLETYVERTAFGCTVTSDPRRAARFSSAACLGADLLLTD